MLVLAFILLEAINYITIGIKQRLFKEKKKKPTIVIPEIPSKRQAGLDIIRFIAVFSVPLIHFFGLSGFYSTELKGNYMLFFTMLRFFAVCAVPLFLMITGYFKITKTVSIAHYKAIVPVLLSHILIAAIRLLVDYKYHHFDVTIEYILDKLLYFEYGWYVKLYIGMLLLMPFLNLCYNALESKRNKEYLILTFIFLTSLGPLCFNIIPPSWLILYVFMYYFIGGYFREYDIKINKAFIFIALFFTLFITAKANLIHSKGGAFDWDYLAYNTNSGYSSFPIVIITSLIFLLFKDIKLKGKIIPEIFRSVSVVSLEMYLFSQMYDGIIYKPFQEVNMDFYFYAEKIYIIIPTIFCLSFITSKIKQFIFWLISAIFNATKKLCFDDEVNDISFTIPIKIKDLEKEEREIADKEKSKKIVAKEKTRLNKKLNFEKKQELNNKAILKSDNNTTIKPVSSSNNKTQSKATNNNKPKSSNKSTNKKRKNKKRKK